MNVIKAISAIAAGLCFFVVMYGEDINGDMISHVSKATLGALALVLGLVSLMGNERN